MLCSAQVVHYELPNSSEMFVHRSGRTGRAGKKGKAIVIYSDHQYREVKAVEREVGCRFIDVSCESIFSSWCELLASFICFMFMMSFPS